MTPPRRPGPVRRAGRARSGSAPARSRRSSGGAGAVRSSSRSCRNWKSERIVSVGDLRGGHVAHEHERARAVAGDLRDARLQVERLARRPPLDLRLARARAARRSDASAPFDGGGQRGPGLAFDRLAIDPDHPANASLARSTITSRSSSSDEAVDGGVEDEAQVLLGRAQRLVRLADALERAGRPPAARPRLSRERGLRVSSPGCSPPGSRGCVPRCRRRAARSSAVDCSVPAPRSLSSAERHGAARRTRRRSTRS